MRLESIDRIKKEITDGNYGDDLKTWATAEISETFFRSSNEEEIINKYAEIMNWVQGQSQYFPEAKAEFAAGADCWLIAYAKVKERILITHETLRPECQRKVPIPNVCNSFGVIWIDTFRS